MSDKKIDITSTAIEKGIELVKSFVEKLVGASFEETGLLIADNIKLIRFKNQLKILTKAQSIVKDSGIDIKQISLKALVPLLEYSSLEDNETLQDRWVNLLVNYVDSNENYTSTIFPFILNQISTNELLELENLYNRNEIIQFTYIDVSNLVRLGVIEKNSETVFGTPSSIVKITKLGKDFVECCSPRKMQ